MSAWRFTGTQGASLANIMRDAPISCKENSSAVWEWTTVSVWKRSKYSLGSRVMSSCSSR